MTDPPGLERSEHVEYSQGAGLRTQVAAASRFLRACIEDHPALLVVGVLSLLLVLSDGLRADGIDFHNLWHASRSIFNRSPAYAENTTQGDFVQPPGIAVLLLPLAALPLSLASKAVVLLGFVLFLVAALAAGRAATSTTAFAVVLIAFGVGSPLRQELVLANVDLLAAGCFSIGVVAFARGYGRIGGVLLGLGLACKPTALLLVLVPIILGDLTAAATAVGVAVLLNIIGFIIVPGSRLFFSSALPYLLNGTTAGYNISLKASLERSGVSSTGIAFVRLAVAGGVAYSLFTWRRSFAMAPSALALFLVTVTCLLSSYYFASYLVYLVVGAGAFHFFVDRRAATAASAGVFLLLSNYVSRAHSHRLDAALSFRWPVAAALVASAVVFQLHVGINGPATTQRETLRDNSVS